MRRLATAAGVVLVATTAPSALTAQGGTAEGSAALSRVETLAEAGRTDAARRELERWFEGPGDAASRREMARARLLRARLIRDADSAEVEYLWVAIDGGAPHGAAAWLRLAQLHLARGEPDRARQELERLRAEYPESEHLPESWLWTGLALEALGELEAACEAWRAARRTARGGEVERGLAARAETALEACEGPALRYAVQLGAFRSRDGARDVVGRATAEGLEPRIERDGGLFKVRVGRFASLESARSMVERARGAGLSAVIVSADPP